MSLLLLVGAAFGAQASESTGKTPPHQNLQQSSSPPASTEANPPTSNSPPNNSRKNSSSKNEAPSQAIAKTSTVETEPELDGEGLDWRIVLAAIGIAINLVWNFGNSVFTNSVANKNRHRDKKLSEYRDVVLGPMGARFDILTSLTDEIRTFARVKTIPDKRNLEETNKKFIKCLQTISSLIRRTNMKPEHKIISLDKLYNEAEDEIYLMLNELLVKNQIDDFDTSSKSIELRISKFHNEVMEELSRHSDAIANTKTK